MNIPTASLHGKTAIVTGGSKGIGSAMALGLGHQGADVAIVSRNVTEGEQVAAQIRAMGRQSLAIACDVTNKVSVDAMVQNAMDAFGHIDILINNAGMNIRKPVVEVEESDWDTVMDTNLKGIFLVAQSVGQEMIRQKKGKIINIASIAAAVGLPNLAAYCASKGGIAQLTKVMALEWAEHNIQVNAVAPAYILTPMTQGLLENPERLNWILGMTPMGRLGTMEEVAGPVMFLASDWSNYITGTVLMVDGGWTAR